MAKDQEDLRQRCVAVTHLLSEQSKTLTIVDCALDILRDIDQGKVPDLTKVKMSCEVVLDWERRRSKIVKLVEDFQDITLRHNE